MAAIDERNVVSVLNRILEDELAGVVRYTHYSFLVFGFGRIPIVSWLREQADESLLHAQQVGEWITKRTNRKTEADVEAITALAQAILRREWHRVKAGT